ncbi:MAG: DUF1667 domain-containing protein [Candidatus Omnitrophica bacterium]|nr:DUF1667 domain-containing protein [Candidatus Omnitrophota bacterium]
MNTKITCVECPKGCVIDVEMENNAIISINGHSCQKGEDYACAEIRHPVRFLTSTVLSEGLEFKMIPVRTDKPIPKNKLFEAMQLVKQIHITESVNTGNVLFSNLLDLNVDLIATRSCHKK